MNVGGDGGTAKGGKKKENCCELLMNYHAGSEEEDPQHGRTMTRVAALLLKPHGQKERQKDQKVSSSCLMDMNISLLLRKRGLMIKIR